MDDAESTDSGNFYPNFSRFYSSRVAPAAEQLITDPEMRQAIFHGNNQFLAVVLNTLDSAATREGLRFAGWHGFPTSVEEWVRGHLPVSD